jgi:hypothetical protein
MYLEKKVVFIFLLLVLSLNAKSDCNTTDIDSFLQIKKAKFIKINTDNSKKWSKNYFKAVISNKIQKERKKRFKSTITVLFDNNVSCTFPAKIRISGDFSDHLSHIIPITSLDVRLLEGNIDSITRFKLFIPRTRNGDNEVVLTVLLRELGFLAPKTYIIPANFNKKDFTYIFQEKINKEFLESNYLREAPIFEGDERGIHNDEKAVNALKYSLGRVSNYKWVNKGLTSLSISKEALSEINKYYLDELSNIHFSTGFNRITPLVNNHLSTLGKNKEIQFNAILIATGASHGLEVNDKRFYYDPMYQYFIPIYYDGMSDILNADKVFQDNNRSFNELETAGANLAIASFENLNREHFKKELSFFGVNYSLKKIDVILNNVMANLKLISSSPSKKGNKSIYAPYFSNKNILEKSMLLVFTTPKEFQIEVCNFTLTACNFENLNLRQYSDIIGGVYSNSYIFVGNKEAYIYGTEVQKYKGENKFNLENGAQLIVYGSPQVLINKEDRAIELKQTSADDRFLLKGGKLEGWSIKGVGNLGKTKNSEQRFNNNLLTGCFTFLDMHIKDVSLDIDGFFCEDAVNFIRANGSLNGITIRNAISDAIDADFSRLNFKNIKVNVAGNDCIDLSGGDYYIENAELYQCADKAISVGEKSKLIVNLVQILESNTGLAAKDSSFVEADNVIVSDVSTCFRAYNKKQEFWGGKIVVNNHNCQQNQSHQNQGSLIEF